MCRVGKWTNDILEVEENGVKLAEPLHVPGVLGDVAVGDGAGEKRLLARAKTPVSCPAYGQYIQLCRGIGQVQKFTPKRGEINHGPLKLRTKHGGDNSRSL
jgi:hypothetical protein